MVVLTNSIEKNYRTQLRPVTHPLGGPRRTSYSRVETLIANVPVFEKIHGNDEDGHGQDTPYDAADCGGAHRGSRCRRRCRRRRRIGRHFVLRLLSVASHLCAVTKKRERIHQINRDSDSLTKLWQAIGKS